MKKKVLEGKDFEFDDHDNIRCDQHFELKDNFMISEIKEYEKYDIICSTCFSMLNRDYDDSLRTKLYSAVIYDNKEKIVQIKEDQINFQLFTVAKSLQVHTHNDIMCLGDELHEFAHSFETNVIDRFTTCKTTDEEILKIKKFINSILNEKNERNLRNIGQNENLKIKYIKLAYFLLKFKGLKKEEMDYTGLTNNLKQHILEIVKKREKINISIDRWIRLILGEFYPYTHELEKLPYEEEFCRSIPKEYVGYESLTEINRLKKIIKEMSIENERLKDVIYFLIKIIKSYKNF